MATRVKFHEVMGVLLLLALVVAISAAIAFSVLYTGMLGKFSKMLQIVRMNEIEQFMARNASVMLAMLRDLNATESSSNLSSTATPDYKNGAMTTPMPAVALYKRINCFPEQQGSADVAWSIRAKQCVERGCVFDPNTYGNRYAPPCYMHPARTGYRVVEVTTSDPNWFLVLKLESLSSKPIFDAPITPILFKAQVWNNHHLQIKIEDPNERRFEVPISLTLAKKEGTSAATADFEFSYQSNPFSFKIIRKTTGAIVFDTSLGGLVYSNQFLQIATALPSDNFYGLGEHDRASLLHNFHYKTWPLWSRRQTIVSNARDGRNLQGTHPFYMVLEKDGKAHGVSFLNSNAMEFSLIPNPGVIMRTIGGIIDMHLTFGPTPKQVIQQHLQTIGRPLIPPLWSLGYHLIPNEIRDLEHLQTLLNETRRHRVTFNVLHLGLEHAESRRDFTLDRTKFGDLPQLLNGQLTNNGLRTTITLDTAITINATSYEAWDVLNGNRSFVRWRNGSNVMGASRQFGRVAYPDFFVARTRETWTDLMKRYHSVVPFSGVEIDMNEPKSLCSKCPDSMLENPPYVPYGAGGLDETTEGFPKASSPLSTNTLCLEALHNDAKYSHYHVHNLYGWSSTHPTLNALQESTMGERGFVLSRSTFTGSGVYAAHSLLGDSKAPSDWSRLHRSIISMLEMSMFGVAQTGAEIICNEIEAELCFRSLQLGAFYPLARLVVAESHLHLFDDLNLKIYLKIRYEMLPYLYTLFYFANKDGSTVARPLFFEYPRDSETWTIDRQFMLGPSYLISALLEPGKLSFTAYVPQGTWFDRLNGEFIDQCSRGGSYLFKLNGTSVLQRGGSIVALQQLNDDGDDNLLKSIKPLVLSVVLGCDYKAQGSLFRDDGTSLDTIAYEEFYLVTYSAEIDQDGLLVFRSSIVHDHDEASSSSSYAADLTYTSLDFAGITQNVVDASVSCRNRGRQPVICPSVKCSQVNDNAMNVTCQFSPEMKFTMDFSVVLSFD